MSEEGGRRFEFVHTGPGTVAGRYLRRFWQPVYLASDLAPGQIMPIRILGEDFTLYRGEGGAPHVVGPRCPHRLTQLSTGWVEADSIRCFYHGWRFEHDGRCVQQPGERAPFCQKITLAAYPTVEYLGFVFAYFGEGTPPPLTKWPEFEHPTQTPNVAMLPCNYFQSAENIMD